MMSPIELARLILTIAALFLLPGWAFLSATRFWQKWDTLQRWCVAIGLSISIYPVLFYTARTLLPSLHLGPNKNLFLLIAFMAVAVWGLRKDLLEQFKFDRLEWLAIVVWGATLFTRWVFAWQNPYPAWSDSLHHTLLTQLTAINGQLPYTLEPYEPARLGMYHLGLYALTGAVQQLAGAPAHTALLWTSQALNGLCGVGVFLALDRRAGRKGALVGSIVVGLLSFQPAWYANWGRFTQVASQTVLLIAWIVTWEVIAAWRQRGHWTRMKLFAGVLAVALLNAAIFLLHFRVAGFYLPLLVITCIIELIQAVKSRAMVRTLVGIIVLGVASFLLAVPALEEALPQYIQSRTAGIVSSATQELARSAFYAFSADAIFTIGLQHWLFYVAYVALIIGLLYRNKMVWVLALWVLALWAEGEAYLLNLRWLAFTNMGAVLIMLYLPAALTIGIAVEELIQRVSILKKASIQRGLLAAILIMALIAGYQRIAGVEAYRQFVTPADLPAMEWIKANSPETAIFAINTYKWLGSSPHGTDGGYWIPYFTGRRTTTGTMLASQGPKMYWQQTRVISDAVEILAASPQAGVGGLCRSGVNYIYIGPRGDFSPPGLDAAQLSSIPGLQLSYAENGAYIFSIPNCP
jgi:hypothetical protein